MTTEIKLQKQRSGTLAQLPILLEGELGYALDAKRLFIGNTQAALDGNNTDTEFNFGVDLDTAPGVSYNVYVDTVLQVESVDYTKNNFVFTFATAPGVGTGNVVLKYNSEIFLFEPDVGLDDPSIVGLTGPATNANIASISFDGTRYDNVDIRYSLRNPTGHIRKGVLSIAVNVDTGLVGEHNTHTISDNHTTNATTAGSLLDHVFSGSMVAGIFTLQYTTTDTETANLAWLANNFKATL